MLSDIISSFAPNDSNYFTSIHSKTELVSAANPKIAAGSTCSTEQYTYSYSPQFIIPSLQTKRWNLWKYASPPILLRLALRSWCCHGSWQMQTWQDNYWPQFTFRQFLGYANRIEQIRKGLHVEMTEFTVLESEVWHVARTLRDHRRKHRVLSRRQLGRYVTNTNHQYSASNSECNCAWTQDQCPEGEPGPPGWVVTGFL